MQVKKTYNSPKLTVYGNVEKVTFGALRTGRTADGVRGGGFAS